MPITNPVIPCKQPKVTITPVDVVGANGQPFTKHQVTCHVPGCTPKVYLASVKTDADDQSTWHRQKHRAAVPKTHISKPTIDRPGYHGTCYDCPWDTPAGVTTRTDVQASLDAHCSSVHGLVTCP